MKRSIYTVSVQWGAGRHYFIAAVDTLPRAQEIATEEAKKLARRGTKGRSPRTRGPKPLVTVWMRRATIDPAVIST